jgi:hypothetical protein
MLTVRSLCEAFSTVMGNDPEASRAKIAIAGRVGGPGFLEQVLAWQEAATYVTQSMISDDPDEAALASKALGITSVFLTVPGTQTISLEPEIAAHHPILAGWVAPHFVDSVANIMRAGAYRAAFAINSPFFTCAEVRSSGALTSGFLDYRFPIAGGGLAEVRALYGHAILPDYQPGLACMTRSRRISGSALLSLGSAANSDDAVSPQPADEDAEPAVVQTGVFAPVLH